MRLGGKEPAGGVRGRRHLRRRLFGVAAIIATLAAMVSGAARDTRAAVHGKSAPAGFTPPTFDMQVGGPGHAYVYPWGMAWDPTTTTFGGTAYPGTILVGDYNNYFIKRFATDGTLLATYSSKGSGPGQLSGQPYGIAVDPNDGSFMVAVLSVHGYMKFDTNGVWIKNVSAPGAYYAPFIATNSLGDVYLVQSTGLSHGAPNVVYMFDNNGTAIGQFGTNGSSCSGGQFSLIRGIDVDAAGNVYVDDVGNRCIQVFDSTGHFLRWFGNGTQMSNNTRGLTIDRTNDTVYVADSALQHVEVYTASTGAFQGTLGTPGSDDGQLGGPRDMAIGTDGTVYVSDYTFWRINAYSPLFDPTNPGLYLHQIPDPPVPPLGGGFNMAVGVAVSPLDGTVYVTDTFNHRVQEFAGITSATPGAFVQMWGSRLPGLGDQFALDYPRGVAVDPSNGNVWVNDTRSGYIKAYTPSGSSVTFDTEFGGQGSAPGKFFYARGLFVGLTGLVYVPDSANARLQVLDQAGNEQPGFPVPCGTKVSNPAAYNGCDGVTVDSAGNIYAASINQGVIDVFNSLGKLVRKIGATAPGGRLGQPFDDAISNNILYVTELKNNRVSEFDLSGHYLGSFGSIGSAAGQFIKPMGIAVDIAGNVYVNDYGNDRIEVFAQPT
jgi:tripartite motif-containing protein 71